MIDAASLAAYYLTAMNVFYPEKNHRFYESNDITAVRYEQFAHDMADVVLDPRVKPLFAGENGRIETGLLLLAIAYFESSYKNDIMSCSKTGDKGAAYGPFQTHNFPDTTCQGNKQAAWVALDMIRESFDVCHKLPLEDRLSEYTDGNEWNTIRASHRSEFRMEKAMHFMVKHKPPEMVDE